MDTDWLEYLCELYELSSKKTLHVDELVKLAVVMERVPFGFTEENLKEKLSYHLNKNAKIKSAQFTKVKNGNGGYKRGVYRFKKQSRLPLTPVVSENFGTAYTGKAGEFAVLSELLFRGFNASIMSVDEGIDLVASKDNKYFHVQVKTANFQPDKPFQATIKSSAFRHAGDVYYVVVLRQPTQVRFHNDYVLFTSSDIRRWVGSGILKEGSTITLRLSGDSQKLILNKKVDVTTHLNDFGAIG